MYGRWVDSQPSQTLPDIIWYSDSRLIYEPTASADVVTVTSLPRALSAAAATQASNSRRRIRDSVRVCADAEWVFERQEAHTISYGHGTVA